MGVSSFLLFYVQLASTAKTNDCALLGPGGCRGQGWDNGEWPILVKRPRSLSDCCKECTKKKGCSGFHIGKLKDEKGAGYLFPHTAITPVKSLGGECYQLKKGKSSDDDDDDDDGPTEEQCQKYVTKACQKKAAKGKDKQREGDGEKKQEKQKEAKPKKVEEDDDDEDDDSEEEYKRLAAKLKEEKAKDKQKEKKVEEKKKDTPDTKQKSESS